MKVILRQEVKNLGREWEVVEVADGYARNYLIPRHIAMNATQASVKDLDRRRDKAAARRQQEEDAARVIAGKLDGIIVSLVERAGPEGRLYGSVTAGDIAEWLEAQHIAVDRKHIIIKDPIRTVGEHHITVDLHSDVTAHVRVHVNPEGLPPVVGPGAPVPASETPEPNDGEVETAEPEADEADEAEETV